MKYFYIWKKNKSLLNAIEFEMKDKKKVYDKTINDSNQKVKILSKKKDDLKTEEQKLITSEQKKQEQKKQLNQSINELSKKLITLRELLEKEKEKSNKNKGNNILNLDKNTPVNSEYDLKKQELENILKQTKEEELITDKFLQEFANIFVQQLNTYEQKAKQLLNEKKKQNSLEISAGEKNEEEKRDSGNNDGIKANSKFFIFL